ncbi:MAG: hypothetical protein CVV44_18770 [Spirochaetae bacterium HGW-Spirochaetae-1]|jgi:hypothetical protein|nr:MAG: hypothetical protein CVV44_18770 [Spirochaetae bacterium HGW-Spirochaetae-1]
MIEISQTNNRREDRTKIKNKGKSSSVGRKDSDFKTELKNAVSFDVQGSLDDLLSDLSDQEKRFLDSQSLYDLNRYKALVQKILKIVLEESIETRTIKRRKSDNKADFLVADIINKKLLEITQNLTRSNPAFNLMKTIEEVRGLILDLVH